MGKLLQNSITYVGELGSYSVHSNGVTVTLPMDVVGTRQQTIFVADEKRIQALHEELGELLAILRAKK